MEIRTVEQYKEVVNRKGKNKKNRNFKFVTVKELRFCKYCCNPIGAGTECLTVNRKMHGRTWVCNDCVQKVLDYKVALSANNSVAFGDEGAAMAMEEWVDECEAALDEVGFLMKIS